MTIYFCCDENRRSLVRAHGTLNGIDFLEVHDDEGQPLADRQRFLLITLLKPPAAPLAEENIRIEGGEVVSDVRVVGLQQDGAVLTVEVDRPGDFSIYTLRLVAEPEASDPPAGYDRLLSAVNFSFKVNCESDFDCGAADDCPPRIFAEPSIDYLARDFNSLRQLMLDRIRLLNPVWQEDHLADFLQAMVDLKAYVGDYQHYQLDAVNTEAYLFTARSRVSVRRHARLVDYFMHDGSSARVWVHFKVAEGVAGPVPLAKRTRVFTRAPNLPPVIQPDSQAYHQLLEAGPQAFETLHDADLFNTHNCMCFHTWGDGRCILPRGAIKAALVGHYPDLQPGMVLILEEVRGSETGIPADADPSKRFAVRLTSVSLGHDDLTGIDLTEITWHAGDALPAPLCLSADVPPTPDGAECGDAISVARGNIILADHGLTQPDEFLGVVPDSTLAYAGRGGRCDPPGPDPNLIPPRFRPGLSARHISQGLPYDHSVAANLSSPQSASAMMKIDPARTLPAVILANDKDFAGQLWKPRRDLLSSAPDKAEFVLEVENDGQAVIRFGDDQNGQRPDPGQSFWARYRSGDPLSGNIGSDTLAHAATPQTAIAGVRNPLAAVGGSGPESMEAVRQNAPQAFRVQERAVTPADYEAVALRYPGVQRAAATIRWTGSWYTVFLTVDRQNSAPITPEFERDFRAHMDAYRMMGYDLEVDAPHFVSLEIELEVCVAPGYFRAQVGAALRDVFSIRQRADGTRGVFHPDNFTFGQTVYLSPIYAAAEAVAGVQSVKVTRFQVQDNPARSGLASGKIPLSRLEIARLENNPNYPKRGVFRLVLKGGK